MTRVNLCSINRNEIKREKKEETKKEKLGTDSSQLAVEFMTALPKKLQKKLQKKLRWNNKSSKKPIQVKNNEEISLRNRRINIKRRSGEHKR